MRWDRSASENPRALHFTMNRKNDAATLAVVFGSGELQPILWPERTRRLSPLITLQKRHQIRDLLLSQQCGQAIRHR